jgi:hypothetical protein
MPFDRKTPHLAPAFGIAQQRHEELIQAVSGAMIEAIKTANHPNQVKAQTAEAILKSQGLTTEETVLLGILIEQSYNAALAHIDSKKPWPFRKKP